MPIPRQIIRDYIKASEDLMKLEDFTDSEIEVMQDMLERISEMLASQRECET